MAVIDLKQTTLFILDGTSPTQLTVEVKIGEGNMTYSERRNMDYILDKGLLDTVREGDQVPVEVRFDFQWEFLKTDGAGPPPTVEEALKNEGAASAWISSATDPCEPYAVDIRLTNTPVCPGVKNEEIYLADFRWESLDHDLRANSVAVSGQANITRAAITRN